MDNVRKCKQCGEVKQLSRDYFRPYYGNSARGFYRVCKSCESINNRYKYLTGKGDAATPEDTKEIEQVEALFSVLRELGLEPPRFGSGNTSPTTVAIDELLQRKLEQVETLKEERDKAKIDIVAPAELVRWLTAPLTEDPEYYEDVYFSLRDRYMPMIGVDEDGLRKHDETYREVLDKIIERFDDYEDNYVYED